jgi:hypothetical protein
VTGDNIQCPYDINTTMNIYIPKDFVSEFIFHLENGLAKTSNPRLCEFIDKVYRKSNTPIRVSYPTGIHEVDLIVLSLLQDKDLKTACVVNKYTANLCRDEEFWRKRIIDRFGADLKGYLNGDETYRDAYLSLTGNRKIRDVAWDKQYMPLLNLDYDDPNKQYYILRIPLKKTSQ